MWLSDSWYYKNIDKIEPKLPSNIQFYNKNMRQIWKTRIEVKAKIIIYANAHKIAHIGINNQCKKIIDIANSNQEVEIDLINIELGKFDI